MVFTGGSFSRGLSLASMYSPPLDPTRLSSSQVPGGPAVPDSHRLPPFDRPRQGWAWNGYPLLGWVCFGGGGFLSAVGRQTQGLAD